MNSLTTEITAPSLSSTQYGQDVSNRFKTIDQNFDKIIESEFLRGKKGDDIKIIEVDLKDLSNEFRSQIESVISEGEQHDPSIDSDGKTINWYDSFSEDAYSKIYLIYQTSEDNGDILISSLPYTFIDARFSKLNVDFDYSDLIDLSCTVYYQNENFVKVQNFPTLYFDDNIKQFCWMINNQKTGLIARGPQGSTGGNGSILLARFAEKIDEEGWVNIDQIYVNDAGDGKPGYINTTDALEKEKIILEEGYVVVGNAVINDQNKFIISPIRQTDTGKWEANIKTGADLSSIVNEENLIISLKSLPNENCRGLFVPFEDKKGYHMLVPYSENGIQKLRIAPFNVINGSDILPNIPLNIDYQNVNIPNSCNISELFVNTKSQLNGSFRCNAQDSTIICEDKKTNITSKYIKLSDDQRSIEIDNGEAQIFIENEDSSIRLMPNTIYLSAQDVFCELGSGSPKKNLSLYNTYDTLSACDAKIHFENRCNEIMPLLSGGELYSNIKTHILLPSNTPDGDRYDNFFPNGIPTMDLKQVHNQLKSMGGDYNVDTNWGSINMSCSIEYIIYNQSGKTRTLLFEHPITNRSRIGNIVKKFELANNHKVSIRYIFGSHVPVEGSTYEGLVILAHDYD